MAVLEWSLLIGVGGWFTLSLLKLVKKNQQEGRLRDAFYYLLEANEGYISLIQLATTARVDAEPARDYLTAQAKVFSAMPEVDNDGDVFYRFPKVERSLSSSPDDAW